jgi:hypothetical protein
MSNSHTFHACTHGFASQLYDLSRCIQYHRVQGH